MLPARDPNSKRVIPLSEARNSAMIGGNGKRARRVKLGRIMVLAGLLSKENMSEALSISKELDTPIGKVLTNTQLVSERNLQSALLAQSMVQEGVLDEQLAIEALKHSASTDTPFSDSLEYARTSLKDREADLQELLLESGMVSEIVLRKALIVRDETGVSLGRALVDMRGIVFGHLDNAFDCLKMISDGQLSKKSAIKALISVRRDNLDLASALRKARVNPKDTGTGLRIGQLLAAAALISEHENLAAVEQSIEEKRLIGEILVGANLVSEAMLADALQLQTFVSRGVLPKEEAIAIIRQMKADGECLVTVVRERGSFLDDRTESSAAIDLLIEAALVERKQLTEAIMNEERFNMSATRSLLASQVISQSVCRAAIESARKVASDELTPSEAVAILHHCDRTRCDFESALNELKIGSSAEASSKEDRHYQLPQWSNSIEAKLAACFLVTAAGGALVTTLLNPSLLAAYGVLIIMFLVGLAFFALGRSWEVRVKAKRKEIQLQEESSRQTLERLNRIKTTREF